MGHWRASVGFSSLELLYVATIAGDIHSVSMKLTRSRSFSPNYCGHYSRAEEHCARRCLSRCYAMVRGFALGFETSRFEMVASWAILLGICVASYCSLSATFGRSVSRSSLHDSQAILAFATFIFPPIDSCSSPASLVADAVLLFFSFFLLLFFVQLMCYSGFTAFRTSGM